MFSGNPMDWGTPQGVAIFFASGALVLASIGVLLWGISLLV
jgi:hypothetical protein